MNRSLPALSEALEDWRDLTGERETVALLFDFPALLDRHQLIQRHLNKLRSQPPLFDANDLRVVLDTLYSATRMKSQIAEGNELDVLIPTLKGFLFDPDEPLAEKLVRYPAQVRYAGATILAELWGWAHLQEYPLFHQKSLNGIRRLGWQVPTGDYLTFTRAFADLRRFYETGSRADTRLPLHLEIDQFLGWVAEADTGTRKTESAKPTPAPTPEETPPAADSTPTPDYGDTTLRAKSSHAIKEFGAPYRPAPAPLNTWADTPLAPPTPEQLGESERRISEELALPSGVVTRAVGHLLAGRHLILTGVPGTGKSHLATLLSREVFGYYPMMVTANAEWSAFDVVGGLVPLADERGNLRYDIRPGVVYEALRRNWWLGDDDTVRRTAEGKPLRMSAVHDSQQYPGVWLIVDELNRADVDKAFGDLFTALESGQLRVPRSGTDASILIPLPRDFRIIATLNSRDRHFLFTLSDALKRRFAFLEIEPPDDATAERAIVLERTIAALESTGLPTSSARLKAALDSLYPVYQLFRAFQPLGTAPLLAALRYVGAVGVVDQRAMHEALQDAVLAEVLPQLEGLRRLPLQVLAALLRGNRQVALDTLNEALAHAYGDDQPLRVLHGVATRINPTLAAESATLLRAVLTDPQTTNRALELLDALRVEAHALPAPVWNRVATQLELWQSER
jgi:MoxR-like ATPase